MRERRFASRLGFHGAGSVTTSTLPSALTVRRPKPRKRQSFFNGLKHEFQREASLHLADHDDFGRGVGKGDEIAAAHLPLDLEPEPLEVGFYRSIEVGFQAR
jgi:hypothetical protein